MKPFKGLWHGGFVAVYPPMFQDGSDVFKMPLLHYTRLFNRCLYPVELVVGRELVKLLGHGRR
mgnify:CR=1 FL=1